MLQLEILPPAEKYLKHLVPSLRRLIRLGIDIIGKNPWCGKALQDDLKGFYTYRAARYRIIYRINDRRKRIEIHTIGPRETIYEDFEPPQS